MITWSFSKTVLRACSVTALVCSACTFALAEELPGFGPLPPLEKEWTLVSQQSKKTPSHTRSSVLFRHAKNGDLLAFGLWRYARPMLKVETGGPWESATADTFPAGMPREDNRPGDPNLTITTLRCKVVGLSFAHAGKSHRQDAMEYTHIYESRTGPSLMAHGYALALAGAQVMVQHTSARPITHETAHEHATGLLFLEAKRLDKAALPAWADIRREAAAVEVLGMKAEALEVTKEKPGWVRVPEQLQQHKATVHLPNGTVNGVSDYKVTRSGWLIAACNYDYQGNSSGDWQESRWDRRQFEDNGWQEMTPASLGGVLVTEQNREQILFIKKVAAGDSGRLRCNKYDPPFLITLQP